MEKFSLMCIWPSSDESKQYLVPSMLMSHPSEDIIRLVASSQIPSLYLTFNSSQVPIGLFPRMVLQFYQWCSEEWPSPCKPQLFHHFARFHVCPDEGCSVILLCHTSFIEIVVHKANKVRDLPERLQAEMKLPPNLASDPSPDVRIARAVRKKVGLMLECMRKEFVWLKNMECEMKVLCSVCCPGGSVHYCRDHGTKGCKQEECLHFWSETNLQSGKLICDRSAVAGDPRLSIKQFASWFAFLDEQQQTIDDECDTRELPSIEGPLLPECLDVQKIPPSQIREPTISLCGTVMKEGTPTDDELEELSNSISTSWTILGRRLKITQAKLDGIVIDTRWPELAEKARRMLLCWKQENGSAATYRVLSDALCHKFVNRKDLAEDICFHKLLKGKQN